MLDILLVSAYFAMVMIFASRESLAALCAFACSMVLSHYNHLFEPWVYHATNIALYAIIAIIVFIPTVKRAAMFIVVFQYIMAWDSYLFSHVETILYGHYALISFILNVVFILSIGNVRGNDVTIYRTDYRAPNYRCSHS